MSSRDGTLNIIRTRALITFNIKGTHAHMKGTRVETTDWC